MTGELYLFWNIPRVIAIEANGKGEENIVFAMQEKQNDLASL